MHGTIARSKPDYWRVLVSRWAVLLSKSFRSATSRGSHCFGCGGTRGALFHLVRLPARIDERAQLDWSGSSLHDRGLVWLTIGGESNRAASFVCSECELTGRRAKTRRSRSRWSRGDKKLGTHKDRKLIRQSIFKRLARRRGSSGPFASGFCSPQLDRAGLRTAWKYVYFLRARHRLTRYVE
jgi:hypothetical protein